MKKVALITGSSRGIGRAEAIALARRGYAVCINYIEHEAEAQETLHLLQSEGHEAIAVRADVSNRTEVEAMVGRPKSVSATSLCL